MNLKFGNCNGTMDVNIYSDDQLIISIVDPLEENIIVDTLLSLPCKLIISLSGKNANDTKLNNGLIVADKYVQLTALSLGNIPVNPKNLFDICNINDSKKDTYWGFNGKVTINFDEENFIAWHLKNGNIFDF